MGACQRLVVRLGLWGLIAAEGACGGSATGTGSDDSAAQDAASSSSGGGSGSSSGSGNDTGASSGSSGGADSGSGGDSGPIDASGGGDSTVADAATDATADGGGDSGADAGWDAGWDGSTDGAVDGDGGPCASGALQCAEGGQPQACVGGQWQNSGGPCSAYAPTPTCRNGVCVCSAPGHLCSGNGVASYCLDDDYYGVPVPCVNQSCVSGQCTGVCMPGQTKCSGDSVQTCDATGQWGTAVACIGGTPFCVGGACTE